MNPMTRYEPLVGRLDGLFNELFRPAFVWENGAAAEAQPIRVDVKETAEAYTVSAEIPGVSKDRIAVEIEGNEVTISAETARRFALPQDLDEGKAQARFADGVLELTLPKKAAVTGRKLDIR